LRQLLDSRFCKRTLQHKIDAWTFDYRNTPHTSTGVSPAELFLGCRPSIPLSLLQPSNLLKWKMEGREKRMEADRAQFTCYQVGDLVWVRSVTHHRLNWLPGVIECMVSSVSYMVICNNRVRQVLTSHLRRRSEGAACLEMDQAGMDMEQPVPDQGAPVPRPPGPPIWRPLSASPPPVPVPAPQVMSNGGAPAPLGGQPSPLRSEVPIPGTVLTPASVVRSFSPELASPDAQKPTPVSSCFPGTPAVQ
jgi:hypothetical protein